MVYFLKGKIPQKYSILIYFIAIDICAVHLFIFKGTVYCPCKRCLCVERLSHIWLQEAGNPIATNLTSDKTTPKATVFLYVSVQIRKTALLVSTLLLNIQRTTMSLDAILDLLP